MHEVDLFVDLPEGDGFGRYGHVDILDVKHLLLLVVCGHSLKICTFMFRYVMYM